MYLMFDGDVLIDDCATLDEVFGYVVRAIIDLGCKAEVSVEPIGEDNDCKIIIKTEDKEVVVRYYEV